MFPIAPIVSDCRIKVQARVAATALLLCLATWTFVPTAHATEGALGRPISGTGVNESAGIVPPEPVWIVNIANIYQDASIGGSRPIPIDGQLSAGIHSDLNFTLATLMKVWDTGPGHWNFSSGITVPYVWNKVTAHLSTLQDTLFTETDQASNIFDLLLTPITAGYHFSQTEHISFALNIWTDTGKYSTANLANPSLNNWTFVPTVSYTKIIPTAGLELDSSLALQFYTKNEATNYQNAPLATLDVMLLKKFASGLSAGVVSGYVQQIGDDTGPTAAKLHGFLGHDISVGPYASYATKIGGLMPLSMSFRWVPTVESKNRMNGSTVMGTVTIIF